MISVYYSSKTTSVILLTDRQTDRRTPGKTKHSGQR